MNLDTLSKNEKFEVLTYFYGYFRLILIQDTLELIIPIIINKYFVQIQSSSKSHCVSFCTFYKIKYII